MNVIVATWIVLAQWTVAGFSGDIVEGPSHAIQNPVAPAVPEIPRLEPPDLPPPVVPTMPSPSPHGSDIPDRKETPESEVKKPKSWLLRDKSGQEWVDEDPERLKAWVEKKNEEIDRSRKKP